MATPAEQVQQAYQAAAGGQTAYARGFSAMLQHLAEQDAAAQQALLARQGITPDQDPGAAQAAASDVLYGTGGYMPGSTLGREGAAFASYAAGLPTLFTEQQRLANIPFQQQLALTQGQLGIQQQQIANDAAQFQQQLALDRQRLAQQSASAAADLAYQQQAAAAEGAGGLDFDDQLALAKFQYQMDQDALERQDKMDEEAAQAESDAQFYATMLSLQGYSPKEIKQFLPLLTGEHGSQLVGALGDARQDQQDAAADAAGRKEDVRQAITGFNVTTLPAGMTKREVVQAILGEIEGTYPNFGGYTRKNVIARINRYVNSQWSIYQKKARGGGGGGNRGWFQRDRFFDQMTGAYNDYLDGLPKPEGSDPFGGGSSEPTPTYQAAFDRIYETMRQKYGGNKPKRWQGGVRDSVVRSRIRSFLRTYNLSPSSSGSRSDPRLGLPPSQQSGLAGRGMSAGPTAAQQRRFQTISRMARRNRTQAQINFMRNYRRRFG